MVQNLPEIGDIVVCKISRVLGYGVFVELIEFNNINGFVPISEIASRWVKNIRNHVKENQIRAAKVLAINREKGHIDLSLLKVSAESQRVRLDEWKKSRRAQKLLEVLAQKKKVAIAEVQTNVAEPLLAHYDSLFEAFQEISMHGADAAVGVPKNWIADVVELCESSVEVPEKSLSGALSLSSTAGDGVEKVRTALQAVVDRSKGEKIQLFYTGSGQFTLRVFAPDYKSAEKILAFVSQAGLDKIKTLGGAGSFQKVEK